MTRDAADLRIGVIGAGRHAQANLYPSLAALGVPITSIVTRSDFTASAAARRFGAAHAHTDISPMLQHDGLDAVIISVDPADHPAITQRCLAAGVDVLVEKPLGLDAQSARRVADVAEQHQQIAMVAFMKRFAPGYVRVAELLADPEFGPVQSFDIEFAFASWTPDLRNDSFLQLAAIHMVDLVRHLLGEVVDVQGMANSTGSAINLAFTLRMQSGAVGTMHLVALPAWERGHERVTISGTDAYVVVDNQTQVRHHRHRSGAAVRWQALDEHTVLTESVVSTGSGGLQDLYRRGFVGEIDAFVRCVADRSTPSCSAADNVATMALCDALLAALER